MVMGRPSRSDEHLLPHEEARIDAEAREYFDAAAPKRHAKPSRSDPQALLPASAPAAADAPIPELAKFQELEAHSQKIVCESEGEGEGEGDRSKPTEEYTATDYYDDLNCVDKHHHTTGSGFIKMEDSNMNTNGNGRCFEIAPATAPAPDMQYPISTCASCSKGNPATNDWIPSSQTCTASLASTKPQRSDNSSSPI